MTRAEILAMETGRELDDLVAKRVMGAVPWGPFQPSTDISAAWEVVERLKAIEKESSRNRPIYLTEIGGCDNPIFVWRCALHDLVNGICADASTAPEAICKAALLAVMA